MRTALFLLPMAGLLGCGQAESTSLTATESPPQNATTVPVKPEVRLADRQRLAAKELGWVEWIRDYDVAATEAKANGKPMFLLFQEVPGCSTCIGFGESVLSHPLVIEAIETEFVPVAILNNKDGKDAEVLRKFSEPSWNNPVVRFVDADGNDLVPRADGVWSIKGISTRMVAALEAAKRPTPDYLRWVNAAKTAVPDSATFAMHCYWSGEACLGDIKGVLSTSAGWLNGREVVEVAFDKNLISEKELRRIADERSCGEFVARAGRARDAKSSDRKYHLQRTSLKYLPLTEWQTARVNAAVGKRQSPTRWLSPRQRDLHEQIQARLEANPKALADLPKVRENLASYEVTLREKLAE